MSVTQIVIGLERSNATGPEADAIAKLGFLEWVFAHPETVTVQVVRAALSEPSLQNPTSAAARAFADVLRQAMQVAGVTPVRRGRAARLVH
ncbi:MAG: hypothetical protein AAFW87_09350 [Pseudomonadota bacterium]